MLFINDFGIRMAKKCTEFVCIFVTLLILSTFLIFIVPRMVYAVQLFSKDEKPFGVSYDDWVAKYWNWDLGLNTHQFAAKQGTCLINNSNLLVIRIKTINCIFDYGDIFGI
jgi:hypothetical protein